MCFWMADWLIPIDSDNSRLVMRLFSTIKENICFRMSLAVAIVSFRSRICPSSSIISSLHTKSLWQGIDT